MPEGVVATPKTSSVSTSEPAVGYDETAPLARYFGVESDSDGKLQTILKNLRGDKQEYNEIDLITDLRGLITKLGNPGLGETLLDRVYSYAKIQNQIDSLQQEQQRLVR